MYHVNRKLLSWCTPEEMETIIQAEQFAEKAHHGQLRDEGVPFITHLIAAADNAARWQCDATTIVATLLHDVVEDTPVGLAEVADAFGDEVAFLVDGATKVTASSREESEKLTQEKISQYLRQDPRLAYVKLADRVHNLQTIHHLSQERRDRIVAESKAFYLPIAKNVSSAEVTKDFEEALFVHLG